MECDTCLFKKHYTTGRDEYPALTTLEYCSKQHWDSGNPEPDNEEITFWENCKDYFHKQSNPVYDDLTGNKIVE